MGLQVIKDYRNNDEYRRSFNELAGLVFGIDFEGWYQMGGWNENYLCYSCLDAGKVVANVSVNKMDLVWEGKRTKALQVGTVMTHPEYRGLGLATRLMQEVLRDYSGTYPYIYLFAHEGAAGFYSQFGFIPLEEKRFSLKIDGRGKKPSGLDRLNITNTEDFKTLERLIASRVPVSPVLGVENDRHLLFFHCLHSFSNHLHYWREQDALVLYEGEGSLLHLYDVISQNPINLRNLIEKIIPAQEVTVVFHFTPDLDGITKEPSDTGDIFFIKPKPQGLAKDFVFPAASRA